MDIRKLTIGDQMQLEELVKRIEEGLKESNRSDFWFPIDEISREHFLDDEWTVFVGAFDEDELIGACGLFLNEHEYGGSLAVAEKENDGRVAEIGRAMVLPKYRGRGLFYDMERELVATCPELRVKHLIATVHPANTPSKKSLEKIGLRRIAHTVKNEHYERDIMWCDLREPELESELADKC